MGKKMRHRVLNGKKDAAPAPEREKDAAPASVLTPVLCGIKFKILKKFEATPAPARKMMQRRLRNTGCSTAEVPI
jgi:hypothetical protein